MIKLNILLSGLFLLGLCTTSFAQSFDWAKSMGGSASDYGHAVTSDAAGNVYMTGFFRDTVDFDPGTGTYNLIAVGGQNAFVLKLNAAGDFVWAKSMGGTGASSVGNAIAVDPSGNVIVVGRFGGTVDFDPGNGTSNMTAMGSFQDAFTVKLNSNGIFQWAKSISGANTEEGKGLMVDASGNIYTIGIFSGTVDFDPGNGTHNITASTGLNSFIQKLSANGNFVWAKTITGGYNFAENGTLDASGNVYLVGIFQGSPDFDPGTGVTTLTASGDSDGYILKLNANGNFVWAKGYGGVGTSCIPNAVAVDASGNVYSTGYFHTPTYVAGGIADFDPGTGTSTLTNMGNEDMFIQKLDASGNFVWVKGNQGTGTVNAEGIVLDASGNIYTSGVFSSAVDFDPNATTNTLTASFYDLFVQKLDASGNLVWVTQSGGASAYVSGLGLAIDASENLLSTGFFYGTVDFDPGTGQSSLSDRGAHDIFIQKLNQCNANDSVTTAGATLTATQAAATYQWLDCTNGNTAITNATNQSYTATANGDYAVIISNGSCVDTSACYTISTVGTTQVSASLMGSSIFPNPTTGQLNIQSDLLIQQAQIYSINGALLSSLEQPNNSLDVSELPEGMYILVLKTEAGYAQTKFVKK